MNKFKLTTIAGIVILVLVLIFQNMESVDTRLLFATISMPRALLLVIVFGLGFLSGLLARLNLKSGKQGTSE